MLTFGEVQNPSCLPRKTTSERLKVLRNPQFFPLFTSKYASRQNGVHFFDISTSKSGPTLVCFVHFDFQMCHNGVQLFISYLARWLRTRRFSEPTFGPKHSVSRLFYLFAHLHLLCSDSFSSLIFSLLLFSSLTFLTSAFSSVHIVGSLTSKLPSTNSKLS